MREGNAAGGTILEEFTYHPTQERVLIKDVYESGVLKESVYYVSIEFVRIENATGNYTEKYVYQDGALVAQVNTDGEKEFVHNDLLGSSVLVTDSSGNIVDEAFFEPFGQELTSFDGSRFSFTGKEQDEITGEYDFDARMYNPMWGRFTTPDTLLPHLYDPQQLNRFSYARNNPYKFIDPDGHAINLPLMLLLGVITIYYTMTVFSPAVDVGGEVFYLGAGLYEDYQEEQRQQEAQEGLDDLQQNLPPRDEAAQSTQEQTQEQPVDLSSLDTQDGSQDGNNPDDGLDFNDVTASNDDDPTSNLGQTDSTSSLNGLSTSSTRSAISLSSFTSSNNFGNRFSYKGGKPQVSKDGTTKLGRGGRSGSFRCNAGSCSVSKAYKKPRYFSKANRNKAR